MNRNSLFLPFSFLELLAWYLTDSMTHAVGQLDVSLETSRAPPGYIIFPTNRANTFGYKRSKEFVLYAPKEQNVPRYVPEILVKKQGHIIHLCFFRNVFSVSSHWDHGGKFSAYFRPN